MKKLCLVLSILFLILLSGPIFLLITNQVKLNGNWRTANHDPSHVLSAYHVGNQAAIVLLSAKAFNWRGMFSTHTWIATKLAGQTVYTIYQVIGWNQYRNKPIVDVSHGIPDRNWYGNKPKVDDILIGKKAAMLIPKVKLAVQQYPYAERYQAWPGPNSNTFINFVLQSVPRLQFQMPYNALGRDYHTTISTAGFSLAGVLGLHVELRQQYIILFGLTLGISWKPFGLILPGVGLVS